MTSVAVTLAGWAEQLEPEPGDLELADRSLRDTVAVALAARDHRVTRLAAGLPDGARWAVAGHVLDFDDLHMPSTTHVSAVCVPTALATGGGPHAYLAAAGVMARLGTALGWRHYSAGWHATCTAGAPASAAGAAVALGLPAERSRWPWRWPCLRPAGSSGPSARTPSRCRSASPSTPGSARPGSRPRARRPIPRPSTRGWTWSAATRPRWIRPGRRYRTRWRSSSTRAVMRCSARSAPCPSWPPELDPDAIRRIVLRTPEAAVVPLIHHRPESGLQGKFSLEYAAAAALLDAYPGFGSFTDAAVRREAARRLVSLVEVKLDPGGSWLLDGELEAEIHTADGTILRASQQFPPGSPARPPTAAQLQAKLADCVRGLDTDPDLVVLG